MRWFIVAIFSLLAAGAQAQIAPPPASSAYPLVVAANGQAGQTANVNQPSVYAVPRSGMYRVSCFVVITTAATTSSTMPGCSATYTEATTGSAVSDIILTTGGTGNTVGLHNGGQTTIMAQASSNLGYVTNGYASTGATPMAYRVDFKIEALQ